MSEPMIVTISEPRPERLKARLKWAGVIALGLLVAAGLAPWTFSAQALREEITTQIRLATGLNTEMRGKTIIAILPHPHVKLDDVSFRDPSGKLKIDTDSIKGSLRLLSLFAGRLEISAATLNGANVVVNLDGTPSKKVDSALSRATETPINSPDAAQLDAARLGILTFVNGQARFIAPQRGLDVTLDNLNLTIDWRNISSPASLTGELRWGGEPAEIAAWIARPAALLRDGQSQTTLLIKSNRLNVTSNGNLTAGQNMKYEGRINATSPSLRRLLRLTNANMPLPGPLENLTLSCEASLTEQSLAFPTLKFTLDGNTYEGTLAVRNEGERPTISGTLATNLLSLNPFIADLPQMLNSYNQWSREPFEKRDMSVADIDLRISATRARLNRALIDDAALSVLLQNGRLEIGLADAKAYKGTLKGRATIVPDGNGVDVRGTLALKDIDTAAFLWDAYARTWVSGALTTNITVESKGDSTAALMQNLDGRGALNLENGEVAGLDLEQALRRLVKRPLISSFTMRSGRTAFNSATTNFHIAKGVAELADTKIIGPGVSLSLEGNVSLADRATQLRAVATQASDDATPKADAPQLRFDVQGLWDDLSIVPDVQSLIRRSGAAAPLLPKAEVVEQPAVAAPPAPEGPKN